MNHYIRNIYPDNIVFVRATEVYRVRRKENKIEKVELSETAFFCLIKVTLEFRLMELVAFCYIQHDTILWLCDRK